MVIAKQSRGFGVGWSGRSAFESVSISQTVRPYSAVSFGGFFPFSQPKKHGSCAQRYQERVRIGRLGFDQMICWWTKAPFFSQDSSTIRWRREACQQYHAAFGRMATSTATLMKLM